MKKLLIAIAVLIGVLCLTGCGGPKTYDEIDYDKLSTMIEEKEDFVLFVGSETCSACSAYKVTVNKIVEKYGVDIKYIDVSKLTEKQNSELTSNFAFSATPTTIFVTKGEEEDTFNRIEGNQKYSEVVERLTKKGYIKEA